MLFHGCAVLLCLVVYLTLLFLPSHLSLKHAQMYVDIQCTMYIHVHMCYTLDNSPPTLSLRVNLDMGKMVYSWMIQRDAAIPGTVVRTSTIPEELGRVEYLLTDKTGTLTQNEMVRVGLSRLPSLTLPPSLSLSLSPSPSLSLPLSPPHTLSLSPSLSSLSLSLLPPSPSLYCTCIYFLAGVS